MCSRREELGLNPDDLGSPWRAAQRSFVAFAAGAGAPSHPLLAGLAGVARHRDPWPGSRSRHCSVSAWVCRCLHGRNALRGALRMVLIGGGAGGLSSCRARPRRRESADGSPP